jgi:oxepin-CoA hydrolase/3-oxo-5,6-dehydrosuberyl-CoA semialdehyde dehydrogenase
MTRILESYAEGRWQPAEPGAPALRSAVNGEPVAIIGAAEVDRAAMLEYGRREAGPRLRAMTFHQRAECLKALAKYLGDFKQEFYELSYLTGATRADTWIDVDGGISTLFVYSSKGRRELPNDRILVEGASEAISRGGSFVGQHICVPLEGVAIQINAFNFPCWGMLEKLAPAILAGMPVLVKPASSTAYLTEHMVRRIVESRLLPEGSVQLLCGPVGDLLDHLTCQDIIGFTGSAATAVKLRTHPAVVGNAVRLNAETDSLNCSVLGPDAAPGTPEFDLFVEEVFREMTSKAGQKCTAIRRALVPGASLDQVQRALIEKLDTLRIGLPSSKDVQMGALASLGQRDEVLQRVAELARESTIVYQRDTLELVEADSRQGAFMSPVVLRVEDPHPGHPVHSVEAFGPVCSLLPYSDAEQAVALARMGEGSLVGSVFSADDEFMRHFVLGTAAMHGRLVLINRHSASESTGHGSPLPHLVHGGPGRAGGGEEQGGIRAVLHHMQRTALQGSPDTLGAVCDRYLPGGTRRVEATHPFRKYFEQLQVGDSLLSEERRISLEDIEAFAQLSGDTFYAHMDEEAAAANPFFDGRVAHGYFLVSAAAGLFVDPATGPVLANYGLENLRFNQPVYPGDSIKVAFTCRQKVNRENAEYGEAHWDVQVTNQAQENVASYEVLTLVAKQNSTAAGQSLEGVV